jgi:hypothetical protein
MNTNFEAFLKENHGKFKILAKIDGEFKSIDHADNEEAAEEKRKAAEDKYGEAIVENNSKIKKM